MKGNSELSENETHSLEDSDDKELNESELEAVLDSVAPEQRKVIERFFKYDCCNGFHYYNNSFIKR